MYRVEHSNNLYKNFCERLNNYVVVLKNNRERKLLKKQNNSILMELKNDFNVENILKHKDFLINLYPELEENIKILEFFRVNNAIDIEQVKNILESLGYSLMFENMKSVDEDLDEIDKKIKSCENILSNSGYDNEFLLEIIEELGFNENEIISILSCFVYNTCKGEVKVKETLEDQKEVLVEDKVDVTDLIEQYKDLEKRIKFIIDKYYILVSGKDKKYLSYTRQVCNYVRECRLNSKEPDIDDNFDYAEESLVLLVINIINYRKEMLSYLDLVQNNTTSKDNKENIEILLSLLEEELNSSDKVIEEYEKEKQEEVLELSNVFVLIDNFGEPVYDVSGFSKEDSKKISILTEKLNKGIYDYNKGVLHSKLQTDYKDNPIFINKISDMACAYIRVDIDKVLIINFDKSENIYDSTDQILSKYSNLIAETILNIKNNNAKTIVLQELVKTKYLQRGLK